MKEVVGRYLQKTTGYLLLLPALYSVIAFFVQIFFKINLLRLGATWDWVTTMTFGSYNAMSAIPFYFGLMAAVGAYLIMNDKKYT